MKINFGINSKLYMIRKMSENILDFLRIYTDFAVDEQKVIDFIERISKNEKVLNGRIKYIFIQENGQSYYKYEK